jgi:hypothetical protein
MKKEKEILAKQSAKYSRLQILTQQTGWQDVLEIIEELYAKNLDKIKAPKSNKEEVEGRGAIKVLEELVDLINSELNFNKVAKEKYIKKYLNQIPNAE